MKKCLFLSLFVLGTIFLTSCKDRCKICTAVSIVAIDGEEDDPISSAPQEYCDGELEAVEDNLFTTSTSEINGTTITTNTTTTCE